LNKPLIINLFAGAGAGKSTTAASIFSELKWRDINCELVTEFAKDLVWEERFKTLENQIYVFGKQLQKINRLNNKVDVIVTDSPLLLSIVYKPENLSDNFNKLIYEIFTSFNNINYFIERRKKYNPKGRMQDEEGAKQFDITVKNVLDEYLIDYKSIPGTKEEIQLIVEEVEQYLNKNND